MGKVNDLDIRDYKVKEDGEVLEIDGALNLLRKYSDQYIEFLRSYKPLTVFQQTERNEALNILKRSQKSINDVEEILMAAIYIRQREESRPKDHILRVENVA